MSDTLLALWIALISADRIDLAGGHGPFILTPFLALTPFVAVSELVRRTMRGEPVVLFRWAVGYAAVAAALLSVVLTSVFFSDEVGTSSARSMLLVAHVSGTFVVAVLASDREDLGRILARGAVATLLLFVVCDIAEALWWIGRGPEILRLGPASIRFDALQNAGVIPRLAGPVADGNRGGFSLVCYTVIIGLGEPRVWLRRLGVATAILLMAATISRSTTLAALATAAMLLFTHRPRISRRVAAAGATVLALSTVVLILNPRVMDRVTNVAYSPLAQRVSTNEGSARSHVELIGRGIDEATSSLQHAMIGMGYGDSYLVLQDMFPGNRYGNFHSLYVTMFAEAGFLGLLAVLVLMATPLIVGGPWRALIAGSLAFNVFYQTTSEPIFWFVVAVAWLSMPVSRDAGEIPHRAYLRS